MNHIIGNIDSVDLITKSIDSIMIEIREEQAPYFTTDEIYYYYNKNNGDVNATIYELLIIKSEDSSITISGLSTQDTSAYFLRLASRFKKFNTGVLTGG